MEYQASSVALSQKLSNGHSLYDGVFSSPSSKFNVSSLSSRVDDYSEIFGGAGGQRGSSIPVLEVPELHERKASVDVRSSQLDYSKVFSGFGDSDFAVPYEELFAEPKKRDTRTRAESSSLPEEADPASPEGSWVSSQEASYESFDSAKKLNMSYHKSNHRSKSFTGGTILHAVPAYTCLVDEVASTPVRMTEGDKPVPSPKENGACFGNNLCERVPEGNNDMKATRDHLAGGAKVQNGFDRKRSISNVELFSAREIGQGTHPFNRTPVSSPLSEGNVEFEKRMASSFGVSKRNVFEGSEGVHSPPYFGEEVETSSVAAASAAALMKAIEEAQARINMAKESKERKKGGLQNHGKLNFNNGTKLEVRKGNTFSDKASIPKERKTQELHEEAAAVIKASISKERKTREFQDEAVAPVKASIPKERKTRELQGEAAPPVKASISKESKTRELQEATGPVKANIPKERKIQELHDVVAAPAKFSDIASKSKERTTQELHEEVVAPVQFTDKASIPKERKTLELLDEVAAPVKFSEEASISKERKTEELHDEVAARVQFADKASISKVRKEELHEEVAAHVKFADEACIPTVRKTEELHEEVAARVKFADEASIPKVRKTEELHEEVAAHVDVSTGPEQVTAAFEGVGKLLGAKEDGGKIEEKDSTSTETRHRHKEVDVSEAGEQFYEFADTGEPDFTEAAEQFYEFSDTSEPDVSEAAELFYEFSDSSEHQATSLELDEASTVGQFVDEDEQKMMKTTMESFENPELEGERLQAAEDEENREIEERLNADGGPSKCEENAHELETAQPFDQKESEKRLEASREHEETEKLKDSQVKEIFEEKPVELEKQKGDNKRLENQEFQEISHVKRKLMAPEWVEYENMGKEACKHEELEREQKHIHWAEDTEKRFNKDNRQEIMEETLNDFNHKEDYEKRDESKSEGNETFEDTGENEIVLEWDACQRKEDENMGKEACEHEELEREQKHVHGEEDAEKMFNKDNRQEIMEGTLNDFNHKEDYEKRDESKSERNEKFEDTEENEIVLAWDACQKKECEKGLKESFQCMEAEGTHILIEPSTEEEKVKVAQEDLKNLESNSESANNLCEQGDSEEVNIKQEPAGHVEEYVKDVEQTPEVPAHEEDGVTLEVTEILVELKENGHQLESFEEDNGMLQKEVHETDALAPGVKVAETEKKIEDTTEIHSSNENGITVDRNDVSFGKNQDQVDRDPEVACNFEEHVKELGDMNKDMLEAEFSVKQEENKNNAKSSHRKRWFDEIDVSETLIKLKETVNQSESAEDENVVEEKEICETDGLVPGVKLAEILKQMEDPIDPHPSESNEINVDRNVMNCGQNQDDQLLRDPIGVCNLEKHVEELEGIQKDPMETVAAVNQEENKSNSKSSHRKRWFGDGNNTEVAHLSNLLRRKGGNVLLDHEMETGLCTNERKEIHENFRANQRLEENEENQQATPTVDSETIDCSLNSLDQEKSEDQQTTSSTEESETSHSSQKNVKEGRKENRQQTTREECETSDNLQKEVVIEKECIIQKDNAKGRERERVKERKAVERVIREARERAFVEARERAAETRQKVMAEAQERLGKTSAKANDMSLAEKASKEAKLKAERAAVERATVEARDRALEKALSGKSAYETGKQAKRSVSEKFSAASRDDGMKSGVLASDPESKGSFPSSTSRYPASSSQGDPFTAERSVGTNGESAQRNKATMERNERTAERAAKALAEKNMRDLLAQKEQAERNRIAETLDAEVKRWSSGKERNLRALLSTLQYVLGPDSGWQPIPLTDVVTAVAVKKAYRKAALFVHPDKLQQRGASIQQKYTCEKVFDLLKEAWNRFNVEER